MNITFIIILLVTIAMSYYGFNNPTFFNRYKFNVGAVQKGDYVRLVSSGFLHANWQHLIFNMISLYFFQDVIIKSMGNLLFLFIYFGSMLLGSVFSLYIYKKQPYYSAIGASGAVSGIIFAAIALYPTALSVNFLPGWLFGALYFGYSVFMMFNPQQGDNLGHAAHLGGALFGLAVVIVYAPEVVIHHAFYLGVMALPLGYMGVRLLKK
ncbi:rhomboid family intramembrane serine protease [Capnocytophaga sp. oral taxon 324]|uniref:rhomboid family intramembrane serine protease n=1 Tax=Capnocytophaga sp. oral taxon 324 TaxID=712211 RepID=UPI0002A32B30|nr:rhomboid family intramembrane serine protease [Capnocytophaga sp. oral taxon 324]EKY10993.1 peptidase, S54 family [Capnocytophaga sp. oral taxon 324 str. F0483]